MDLSTLSSNLESASDEKSSLSMSSIQSLMFTIAGFESNLVYDRASNSSFDLETVFSPKQ